MVLEYAPYQDGDLLEWVSKFHPGEWRKNEPFRATLSYDAWERGRSAVRIWWKDADGHSYPMFMTDFDDVLNAGEIVPVYGPGEPTPDGIAQVVRVGSAVMGTWLVVKRGANYGIQLVGATS